MINKSKGKEAEDCKEEGTDGKMESNLPGAGQGTDKYSKVCPQKKEKQDGKNRRIVAGKVTLQVMNQKAEQEENKTAYYGNYFFSFGRLLCPK